MKKLRIRMLVLIIRYRNYLGKECSDDLIGLYNKSIRETIKYINRVNDYLEVG